MRGRMSRLLQHPSSRPSGHGITLGTPQIEVGRRVAGRMRLARGAIAMSASSGRRAFS